MATVGSGRESGSPRGTGLQARPGAGARGQRRAQQGPPAAAGRPLPAALAGALAELRTVLEPCGDIIFRPFTLASVPPVDAAVVYAAHIVDAKAMGQLILKTLMVELPRVAGAPREGLSAGELCTLVEQSGLPVSMPRPAPTVQEAVDLILEGFVAVLVDGCAGALMVELKAQVGRDITEPTTEGTVRGPREGFVELLETNLGLLRRRLPVPEFRVEKRRVGRRTRTEVAVVWLDGLPKPGVLDEVRQRLDRIEMDGVLDSAYIEEMIEDHPLSPFPTIEHTERPDKVAAALLEGRVAILTANSPYVLMLPVSFAQFLQSAEDYYERYFIANGIRMVRYFAFLIALTLPSIYVAVTTYHHEMIPSTLFIALAAQREGVPFPAILEAFLMEVAFELLREAGVRLPRPVGQAVSIIGGLVIGEAAIRARVASAGMVIVVATTGIASFAIPAFNLAITLRLMRFPMMVLAATLGLHGVVVGLLALLIHMAGLRSFGVPYLSPVTPATPGDWKDVLVRAPWWKMHRRPQFLGHRERQRVPPGQRPDRGGS